MQTAIITGASDDLIHIDGVKGGDEFPTSDYGKAYAGTFNLGGRMRIHAIYDGCWSFAIGQVDEGIPLPDWPVRLMQDTEVPYSARVEIDVPDDVKVFREGSSA